MEGKLGHSISEGISFHKKVTSPKQLESLNDSIIVYASCGETFSLALTVNGELY